MATEYTEEQAEIVARFTYLGCTIEWSHVAPKDRDGFRETIGAYAAALKQMYDIETDLHGADFSLDIQHRGVSQAVDRQILKGIVGSIVGDTIWGGGGPG